VLPVVSARVASKNTESMQWTSLAELFNVTDADGDPIVRFEVQDDTTTAGSGRLWWVGFGAGNAGYVAAGVPVSISVSELSNVWMQGGANLGTDTLQVRANDGYGWSSWASVDVVTRAPNRAPILTPVSSTPGVALGQTVAVSTLFSTSDADGDAITRYRFWDNGTGGGEFRVNGVAKTPKMEFEVDAAALADTVYAAGAVTGTEGIAISVYDGAAWSAWGNMYMRNLEPVDRAGNTVATGHSVTLDTSAQIFSDWLGSGDGIDIYTFTLNSAQTVDLDIAGLNSGGSIQVAIYDGGGTIVPNTTLQATDSTPASGSLNLASGSYSLRLVTLGSSNTNYDLTLSSS
jgi:hypothetical protein